MSHVNTDRTAHAAGLVHIVLTPEEIERITGGLDVTTASVAKVSEVTIADISTTPYVIPLINVMYEDIVSLTLNREEVLSQAPASEEGMFLVPQTLGEE